jgi:hypothetical protein
MHGVDPIVAAAAGYRASALRLRPWSVLLLGATSVLLTAYGAVCVRRLFSRSLCSGMPVHVPSTRGGDPHQLERRFSCLSVQE